MTTSQKCTACSEAVAFCSTPPVCILEPPPKLSVCHELHASVPVRSYLHHA
jgi:hypothetical protein